MKTKIHNYFIAAVWFVNGMLCKVMNLEPRHEQIVSRILGAEYSKLLIVIIGILEILMAFWILSNYKKKLNTITQIVVVLAMNTLEFIIAPDLLLWGKFNLVFALLFVFMIYYNLKLNKNLNIQNHAIAS